MLPRRSPYLDAVKENSRRDSASDYPQSLTPSVGCTLEYESYGGARRLVIVDEVDEVDPEKGRPTFSGQCVASEDNGASLSAGGNIVWGFWSQIKLIKSRDGEVRA